MASPRATTKHTIAVDVLLSFAAALLSLRLAGQLLRARRYAWAGGLLTFAAAAGDDGVGRGTRLGRGLVPRLLPRGRAALGPAPRRRLAADRRPALGGAVGLALHRLAIGRRGRDAAARVVRLDRRPRTRRTTSTSLPRVVAIAGSSLGALAVVVVAALTLRRRPLGNALLVAAVGPPQSPRRSRRPPSPRQPPALRPRRPCSTRRDAAR